MGPSCCPRPPPLLVLALCWFLTSRTLGLPVQTSGVSSGAPPRGDLQESATGDDLISGSDFLSVFIGAALPSGARQPSRARGLPAVVVVPPPDSKATPFSEEDNKLGAYGARLIPKPKPKTIKNSPTQARHPSLTPSLPPSPPTTNGLGKSVTEILPFSHDFSESKTPYPQTVSFNPSNIDSNPLPEASAKILHRIEPPKVEVGTESLLIRSKIDGTPRLRDYDTQTPKEEVTTTLQSIITTEKDSIVESLVPGVDEETQAYTSELTIITEVVTSRKENNPTEPTIVVSKEAFGNNEKSDISYERAINDPDPKEHPDKTPPDDHLNSVTVPTSEEGTAVVQENSSQNTAVPTFPPVLPSVQQVVSVRFSSSVVQGPSPAPDDSGGKQDVLAQTPAASASEEEMQHQIETEPANCITAERSLTSKIEALEPPQPTLVTEERPTNIAVQRSEFSVEESGPSSSELSPRHVEQPSIFHKTVARVVEVSRNSPAAPVSYHTSVSSATSGSRVQFYSEPPSYHRDLPSNVAESIRTSVVTSHQHSGGITRPKFEHISGLSLGSASKEESIESRMGRYGTPHHEVRISSANDHIRFSSEVHSSEQKSSGTSIRDQKSVRNSERLEQTFEFPEQKYVKPENIYVNPIRNYAQPERIYAQPEQNYAQTERNYAHPERTYSLPEQNYEVNEAVSVMSNGRVHGLQVTTPATVPLPQARVPPVSPSPPPAPRLPPDSTSTGAAVERAIGLDASQGRDPNHKFGYVVEGRNFRRYRVEERTPDGFIVGEYGVVSHDDGSLRGVRYTADGTINPQLIHEALVKFLSL